ncbi:hypothetical protein ABBQ38_011146 [Trebouxia sp. C0009 RCD-2024]
MATQQSPDASTVCVLCATERKDISISLLQACFASCRSEHFQEFFHAAKGTSTALNDNQASPSDIPSVPNNQDALHASDTNTGSPSTHDPPASLAQSTLETVPQNQDAQPAQTDAPPPDDDPQTLRQLQHEQAESSGRADLQVRFADVGCGFGGLLVRLSPMYPDKLMVGMEIRDKVTNYVIERVAALRREQPGKFTNITALRNNAMRHLPNYFVKGQLHKLFFLFPDPHFKTANHRRRIIQTSLLAEYAYCLAVGGMLYTITDVPELGEWMQAKLDAHPLFERMSDAELNSDSAANLLISASEEAQKVARNEGKTFRNVYRRVRDPES